MTDNSPEPVDPEAEAMETADVAALHETLAQLREEIGRLRASRERLVGAADAELRALERELHRGLQQQLVAIAVEIQLLEEELGNDAAAANDRLRGLRRDVQKALDEAGRLAHRIHPPLLEAGGLAVALRAAATAAGVEATIEVAPRAGYPPEIARTISLCFLTALENAGSGTRATVAVHAAEAEITFEITTVGDPDGPGLDVLCDRIETLDGRVTTVAADGVRRMSGRFPASPLSSPRDRGRRP